MGSLLASSSVFKQIINKVAEECNNCTFRLTDCICMVLSLFLSISLLSLSHTHTYSCLDAMRLRMALGGSCADLLNCALLSGRIRWGFVVSRMRRWKLHSFQDWINNNQTKAAFTAFRHSEVQRAYWKTAKGGTWSFAKLTRARYS